MQNRQQHTLGRHSQPSLAGMLAQQHQDEIARVVEQRRKVDVALAGSADNGSATRVTRARAFDAVQTRLAVVRPAIARAIRLRPVTSHASATVACCA